MYHCVCVCAFACMSVCTITCVVASVHLRICHVRQSQSNHIYLRSKVFFFVPAKRVHHPPPPPPAPILDNVLIHHVAAAELPEWIVLRLFLFASVYRCHRSSSNSTLQRYSLAVLNEKHVPRSALYQLCSSWRTSYHSQHDCLTSGYEKHITSRTDQNLTPGWCWATPGDTARLALPC